MILFDNNQSKDDFDRNMQNLMERAVEAALENECFDKPYEISVLITDNYGIKDINKEHRNIDSETDVLSFPMLQFIGGYFTKDNYKPDYCDLDPDTGEIVLGDIVISIEKAKEQAKIYGHSVEREVAYLTVHSVLHLLGHDHEKDEDKAIMRKKEEEILKRLGLLRQ